LKRVREELAGHFAEEEDGGCLEEAVCSGRDLSAALRQIEKEHPLLLARLDQLIEMARSTNKTAQDWASLREAFATLCHDLHAHEAAENDLLRRGFGVDV
jgi:hypothetical protein